MKPLKKHETTPSSRLTYLVMYILATTLLVMTIMALVKDIQHGHVGMSILHSIATLFLVSFGGITLADYTQHYHEDAFWYFDGFTAHIFHMCFVWTITYYVVQMLKQLPS